MKKIAEVLNKAKKIAIFVHMSADGDALGSAFAVKYALEKSGKIADVYLNENVSDRLLFLTEFALSGWTVGEIKEDYDVMLSLDCGDETRLGMYKDAFLKHKLTVNIDHHKTNKGFAKHNYVDGDAAATGVLIYKLFDELDTKLDEISTSLLYSAISSDTGCFAFSNADSSVHEIVADLMKCDFDHAKINRLLFATSTIEELALKSLVINNIRLYFDGKLAIAEVTEEQLSRIGAKYEHTEGAIDVLRSVKGVEVGCLIKQKDGITKGSIRTNSYVDASNIAMHLGGGGHIRAAGFSTDLSVSETEKKIVGIVATLI